MAEPILLSDKRPSPISELSTLTKQVSLSIQQLAFHYFTRNFVDIQWRYQDGLWGLLNSQAGFEFGPSQPETPINLAATSVSLVLFGRLRKCQDAIDLSHEKYSKALLQTRAAVGDLSQAAADQTLSAVMMLAAYEVSSSSSL